MTTPTPNTARSRRGRARARALLHVPASPSGHLGAAVCFSASVVPSLYPRPWLAQGVLSGVALAVGYGLGAAAGAGWRRATGRRPRRRAPTPLRAAVAVAAVGLVLWLLLLNYRWQVDVRELMGVPGGVGVYPAAMTPVALAAGYALVVSARLVRATHRRYVRVVARLVPKPARLAVRVLVAVLLVVFVVDVVVGGWAFSAFNAALVAGDARVDAGVEAPTSTHRSGGPASLVAWDTLGSRGRAFVSEGPRVEQLSAFNGEPALVPVRVYAGLGSAGSHRRRAALAVAELERTGAFERGVLLVITPTGSGGVNSYAMDALEYLHNGDTAAVAVQYSYLPSWVVLAGDQDEARRAARALFEAVASRLRQLPASSRPRLLVYGESLGSFGSESVFDGLEDLRGQIDGALWVGPPRANPLWREFTAGRDDGSPVWQPVYRGGTHVRFGWDGASLSRPDRRWRPPRVAYLQHASDPITWWSPALLFERPEWLDEPRGPDISAAMTYVPVVTFLQVTVDMLLGAGAPVEHGHIYGPAQAEAWALIAAPDTWTAGDTRRLRALLAGA